MASFQDYNETLGVAVGKSQVLQLPCLENKALGLVSSYILSKSLTFSLRVTTYKLLSTH